MSIQAKVKNFGFLLYDRLKVKIKEEIITIKNKTLNEHLFTRSKRVKRSNGEIEIMEGEEDEEED